MDPLLRLERRIAGGVAALPEEIRSGCRRVVMGCQEADGGFRGREGAADLWYTGFAVRCLGLTGEVDARVLDWVAMQPVPEDPPGVLSYISVLGRSAGFSRHGRPASAGRAVARFLALRPAEAGRTCRLKAALHGYLTVCAHQLLGEPQGPCAPDLLALLNADGGFSDRPGGSSQTSSTAAVLASLVLLRSLGDGVATDAAAFLAAQQMPDGGLRPHPTAPGSDLLSTFTAAWALALAGRLDRLDRGGLGRFVRERLLPDGGFGAAAGDDGSDPEYTYYGLALLGLLSAEAGRSARPPRQPLTLTGMLLAWRPTRRLGWRLLARGSPA